MTVHKHNYKPIIPATCELCGRTAVLQPCVCGHKVGNKINIIIDHNPEANFKTHNNIRWYCKICNSKGIMWQRKKDNKILCPNCGIRISQYRTSIVSSKGNCAKSSVWAPKDNFGVTNG